MICALTLLLCGDDLLQVPDCDAVEARQERATLDGEELPALGLGPKLSREGLGVDLRHLRACVDLLTVHNKQNAN